MDAQQLASQSEDKRLVSELKCSNGLLLAENDMFERFLTHLDQLDHQAGTSALDGTGSTQRDTLSGTLGLQMQGRRRSSRSFLSDGLEELTLEQKLYLVQRDVAQTNQDQKNLQHRYEKIEDDYKAFLKEAELRLEDIRRARTVFERKLQAHMKDSRLEKKEPEKLLHYVEDKSKVTLSEKLHLKNQALKVLEKKLEQQLQHKRDAAKAEYEEVFQDYGEPTEDKNLAQLQDNSLRVQRNLVSHKEKLHCVSSESNQLSSDINNRRQKLLRLEEKLQKVEEERLREEALNQGLRHQVAQYQAPGVAEYMQAKEKHRRLQQSVHTWEKKVEVVQTTLRANAKAAAPCRGGHVSVRLPCIAGHDQYRAQDKEKPDDGRECFQ